MDEPVSGHQDAAAGEAAAPERSRAEAAARYRATISAAAAYAAAVAASRAPRTHAEWPAWARKIAAARRSASKSRARLTDTSTDTSARAGSKTGNSLSKFSNQEAFAMARSPRPDLIALAISALAAAVSIACAVRDARTEPVAVTVAGAQLAEPVAAPHTLDAE